MPNTYFKDHLGTSLGSADGVLPIPLVKGMPITIEGYQDEFHVVGWSYHHGHDADEDGLRIILRSMETQ